MFSIQTKLGICQEQVHPAFRASRLRLLILVSVKSARHHAPHHATSAY